MKKSLLYVLLIMTNLVVAGVSSADATTTTTRKHINLQKDFDSLGGNDAVVQRARLMDPKNKVKVVQNRNVDRNMRFEIGANYSYVAGGDSYYQTQNLGANLDFHINPHWSIGARYYKSFSNLTPEGQAVYNQAQSQAAVNGNYQVPQLDYPVQTGLAVVNWYPFYGKLNMFDAGVAHFDLYLLGGYGKTFLNSGPSDTFTGGAGIALWLTQMLTFRFEGRYQTYQEQVYTGVQANNSVVLTASIGLLL